MERDQVVLEVLGALGGARRGPKVRHVHLVPGRLRRHRHAVGLGRSGVPDVARRLLQRHEDGVDGAVGASGEEAAHRRTAIRGRVQHHELVVLSGRASGNEQPVPGRVHGREPGEAFGGDDAAAVRGQVGELHRTPLVGSPVRGRGDRHARRGKAAPVGRPNQRQIDRGDPAVLEATIEVGAGDVDAPHAAVGGRDERHTGRVVEPSGEGRPGDQRLVAGGRHQQQGQKKGEAHQRGAHPRDLRPGVARRSGEPRTDGRAGLFPSASRRGVARSTGGPPVVGEDALDPVGVGVRPAG